MARVLVDDEAIASMLLSEDGPVGRFIVDKGEVVLAEAKRTVPVNPLFRLLVGSLTTEVTEDRGGVRVRVGPDSSAPRQRSTGMSQGEVMEAVEFGSGGRGTRRARPRPARPVMRNALERAR